MYQITVAYDGNPIHFNKNYEDALQAFEGFLAFKDWGWANEYSTVNLLIPTGKLYTKVFYRDGRIVTR